MAQNSPITGNLSVTNSGNIACDVQLSFNAPDGLNVELESDLLEMVAVGETRTLVYTLSSENLRGVQVEVDSEQALRPIHLH